MASPIAARIAVQYGRKRNHGRESDQPIVKVACNVLQDLLDRKREEILYSVSRHIRSPHVVPVSTLQVGSSHAVLLRGCSTGLEAKTNGAASPRRIRRDWRVGC